MVVDELGFTIGSGRNDGFDAAGRQLVPNGIGIVALVGDQGLDFLFDETEERLERLAVVDFPAGEDEADRPTFAVAAGVDLGGEAATASPQSLRVLIPPFTPAAF